MNNNYLVVTDLYKTGFISNDTSLRKKQGLASQQSTIVSCTTTNTLSSARQEGGACYQYPITLSTVNYGSDSISDNCPCTRFVQSQ